jgi:hypothetical protein
MQRDRSSRTPFDKKVGAGSVENPDTMPPIFSFEKMLDGSGYSVNCCDQENQAAALKSLFKLSRMKWQEIRNAPRHGLGTEKIARTSIKAPIPAGISEDVTFLAIRYHGRRPMLGYRDGRTFHIIFLDHNFSVYDHG